jgi:hypothetical protein
MQQAIQHRLDRLSTVAGVQAALLMMHASSGADRFDFPARGADDAVQALLAPLAHRYQQEGKAPLLNEPVNVAGQALHLLCDSHAGAFLLAVTLPLADAWQLSQMRNALQKILRTCVDEANSMRWR